MKKIVLVLLAMVILSGCVNKVWLGPPGTTQMDLERDKAQCMYEARVYTPPSRAYVPPAPRDRYGISGAIATGFAQGIEEGLRMANLFGMCMRARGYYLVDKRQPIPISDVVPPLNEPEKKRPERSGRTFKGANHPEDVARDGCYWQVDQIKTYQSTDDWDWYEECNSIE
jgi:hypothetical protein